MIAERIEAHGLRLLNLTAGRTHRSFPARFNGELSCVKTSLLSNRYEIRAGGRCIASLRLIGLFRPTASATTDDGAWFFEPERK